MNEDSDGRCAIFGHVRYEMLIDQAAKLRRTILLPHFYTTNHSESGSYGELVLVAVIGTEDAFSSPNEATC